MTLGVRALAVTLMLGCNPYDEIPRARCQSAEYDCRAGEACRSGYCWGDRSLVVRVSAGRESTPMRAALITSPTALDPRETDTARLLEVGTTDDGSIAWQDIPRLPSWVLVWEGGEEEVCAGDAFTLVRAPEVHEGRLVLRASRTWDGECFALPRTLGYGDRAFARGTGD